MGFLSNKIWVRIFLGHPVWYCHAKAPLSPASPPLKVRGGSAPVMHPNSGVPEDDSSAFLKF